MDNRDIWQEKSGNLMLSTCLDYIYIYDRMSIGLYNINCLDIYKLRLSHTKDSNDGT